MLDLYRTVKADPDQTTELINVLRRIAEALERVSPVPTVEDAYVPQQATADDVKQATQAVRDEVIAAKQEFAKHTNTRVDSEAFFEQLYIAEEKVAQQYGEEFVDKLDWNKHGRLFNREIYHKEHVARQRKERDKANNKKAGKEDIGNGPVEQKVTSIDRAPESFP